VEFKNGVIVENDILNGFSDEIKGLVYARTHAHSFCFDFLMLLMRSLVITMRNRLVLAAKIGQALITATIVSVIWTNVSQLQSGIQDRIGLMFMSMANPIMGTVSTVILTFAEERKVLIRERTNNLYNIFAYYVAKVLMDLPHLFISTSLFGMIIYLSTRLNEIYAWKYFVYIGYGLFIATLGAAYGYFIGTLGKTQEQMTLMNPMLTVPLMVLSGFFTSYTNYAPYLLPFYYISPFKYGFELFLNNEFTNAQAFYCNLDGQICDPLSLYTFPDSPWQDYIIISALMIGFHLVGFTLLWKNAKISV